MSSYSIDIRLTDEYISIGPVALRPRGSKVEDLTRVLGPPTRVLPLSHGNTVYIYDLLGIRFWAEAGIVGEFQLVLEPEERETFPKQAFVGPIEYLRQVIYPPVSGQLLGTGNFAAFVQDTDPLQYGVIMFVAHMPLITYTAIVNNTTGNIKTLSVS